MDGLIHLTWQIKISRHTVLGRPLTLQASPTDVHHQTDHLVFLKSASVGNGDCSQWAITFIWSARLSMCDSNCLCVIEIVCSAEMEQIDWWLLGVSIAIATITDNWTFRCTYDHELSRAPCHHGASGFTKKANKILATLGTNMASPTALLKKAGVHSKIDWGCHKPINTSNSSGRKMRWRLNEKMREVVVIHGTRAPPKERPMHWDTSTYHSKRWPSIRRLCFK